MTKYVQIKEPTRQKLCYIPESQPVTKRAMGFQTPQSLQTYSINKQTTRLGDLLFLDSLLPFLKYQSRRCQVGRKVKHAMATFIWSCLERRLNHFQS